MHGGTHAFVLVFVFWSQICLSVLCLISYPKKYKMQGDALGIFCMWTYNIKHVIYILLLDVSCCLLLRVSWCSCFLVFQVSYGFLFLVFPNPKSMKGRAEWSPFLFKLLYFGAICFCLYSLSDFLSLSLKRLCQAANTMKNVYRASYKSNDAAVCVEARVWQQHCLSLSLSSWLGPCAFVFVT